MEESSEENRKNSFICDKTFIPSSVKKINSKMEEQTSLIRNSKNFYRAIYKHCTKVYTDWANHYLTSEFIKFHNSQNHNNPQNGNNRQMPKSYRIQDLQMDLKDGTILSQLILALTKHPIDSINPNPQNEKQMIKNIEICLDRLQEIGIPINQIHAQDIFDGNLKSILGLLFNLSRYDKVRFADRNTKSCDQTPQNTDAPYVMDMENDKNLKITSQSISNPYHNNQTDMIQSSLAASKLRKPQNFAVTNNNLKGTVNSQINESTNNISAMGEGKARKYVVKGNGPNIKIKLMSSSQYPNKKLQNSATFRVQPPSKLVSPNQNIGQEKIDLKLDHSIVNDKLGGMNEILLDGEIEMKTHAADGETPLTKESNENMRYKTLTIPRTRRLTKMTKNKDCNTNSTTQMAQNGLETENQNNQEIIEAENGVVEITSNNNVLNQPRSKGQLKVPSTSYKNGVLRSQNLTDSRLRLNSCNVNNKFPNNNQDSIKFQLSPSNQDQNLPLSRKSCITASKDTLNISTASSSKLSNTVVRDKTKSISGKETSGPRINNLKSTTIGVKPKRVGHQKSGTTLKSNSPSTITSCTSLNSLESSTTSVSLRKSIGKSVLTNINNNNVPSPNSGIPKPKKTTNSKLQPRSNNILVVSSENLCKDIPPNSINSVALKTKSAFDLNQITKGVTEEIGNNDIEGQNILKLPTSPTLNDCQTHYTSANAPSPVKLTIIPSSHLLNFHSKSNTNIHTNSNFISSNNAAMSFQNLSNNHKINQQNQYVGPSIALVSPIKNENHQNYSTPPYNNINPNSNQKKLSSYTNNDGTTIQRLHIKKHLYQQQMALQNRNVLTTKEPSQEYDNEKHLAHNNSSILSPQMIYKSPSIGYASDGEGLKLSQKQRRMMLMLRQKQDLLANYGSKFWEQRVDQRTPNYLGSDNPKRSMQENSNLIQLNGHSQQPIQYKSQLNIRNDKMIDFNNNYNYKMDDDGRNCCDSLNKKRVTQLVNPYNKTSQNTNTANGHYNTLSPYDKKYISSPNQSGKRPPNYTNNTYEQQNCNENPTTDDFSHTLSRNRTATTGMPYYPWASNTLMIQRSKYQNGTGPGHRNGSCNVAPSVISFKSTPPNYKPFSFAYGGGGDTSSSHLTSPLEHGISPNQYPSSLKMPGRNRLTLNYSTNTSMVNPNNNFTGNYSTSPFTLHKRVINSKNLPTQNHNSNTKMMMGVGGSLDDILVDDPFLDLNLKLNMPSVPKIFDTTQGSSHKSSEDKTVLDDTLNNCDDVYEEAEPSTTAFDNMPNNLQSLDITNRTHRPNIKQDHCTTLSNNKITADNFINQLNEQIKVYDRKLGCSDQIDSEDTNINDSTVIKAMPLLSTHVPKVQNEMIQPLTNITQDKCTLDKKRLIFHNHHESFPKASNTNKKNHFHNQSIMMENAPKLNGNATLNNQTLQREPKSMRSGISPIGNVYGMGMPTLASLKESTNFMRQSPLNMPSYPHKRDIASETDQDYSSSVASHISNISSPYSSLNTPEEKYTYEILKLKRELESAQEKVNSLTNQLSTNASVVAAFEQSLTSLTSRFRELNANSLAKDSELIYLRSLIQDINRQKTQIENNFDAIKNSNDHCATQDNGKCKEKIEESVVSGEDTPSKLAKKKRNWLRSSFTKAFIKNGRKGSTDISETTESPNGAKKHGMETLKPFSEIPENNIKPSSLGPVKQTLEPKKTDEIPSRPMNGEDEKEHIIRMLSNVTPPETLIKTLIEKLRIKDNTITECQLRTMASKRAVEIMKETLLATRQEVNKLKRDNEKLQNLIKQVTNYTSSRPLNTDIESNTSQVDTIPETTLTKQDIRDEKNEENIKISNDPTVTTSKNAINGAINNPDDASITNDDCVESINPINDPNNVVSVNGSVKKQILMFKSVTNYTSGKYPSSLFETRSLDRRYMATPKNNDLSTAADNQTLVIKRIASGKSNDTNPNISNCDSASSLKDKISCSNHTSDGLTHKSKMIAYVNPTSHTYQKIDKALINITEPDNNDIDFGKEKPNFKSFVQCNTLDRYRKRENGGNNVPSGLKQPTTFLKQRLDRGKTNIINNDHTDYRSLPRHLLQQ